MRTLTRRRAIESSLVGLAGAAALTIPPRARVFAQSSATPFSAEQRAVAETGLGPALPPFLPIVGTTVPKKG